LTVGLTKTSSLRSARGAIADFCPAPAGSLGPDVSGAAPKEGDRVSHTRSGPIRIRREGRTMRCRILTALALRKPATGTLLSSHKNRVELSAFAGHRPGDGNVRRGTRLPVRCQRIYQADTMISKRAADERMRPRGAV
jgi:hypothetical protein